MSHEFIRVSRTPEGAWTVTSGPPCGNVKDFRVKTHAVAYARALSWSLRSNLLIDDAHGQPVRQSRASMTYPVQLD